jgi:DNA-directed RNA polymerase specialized sigma24 family protein
VTSTTFPRKARVVGLPVEAHSFDEFYRTQVDAIYRALTVALADAHLAREAVDEAMTRAYARWATVARYDNPGGWVFRVGLNWATSWRRTRRLERPLPDDRADAVATPVQARLAFFDSHTGPIHHC